MAGSACISSIIRLVYSVRLTQAIDKTWVCMWAFAEFTTVIIAGAFPTLPRLIQWLRGHKDSSTYVQPDQKPSKPSCVNGLADVEAGHRGRKLNLVAATRNSYILLEENLERKGQGYTSETQQEPLGKSLSALSQDGREAGERVGERPQVL